MYLKLIAKITMLFGILLMAYPFYLWYTYIDEKVIEGEAYGLVIGESKLKAYQGVPLAFSEIAGGELIFIDIVVNETNAQSLATNEGNTIIVQTRLHDIGFEEFEPKDQWDFYIGGSYFNTLRLTFCKGKLCEIYRHRKYFEFP